MRQKTNSGMGDDQEDEDDADDVQQKCSSLNYSNILASAPHLSITPHAI